MSDLPIRQLGTHRDVRTVSARSLDRVGLATGALSVSASAVLLKVAATTPATATAARCLIALPVVLALAIRECRRHGGMSSGGLLSAAFCGALFAGDMLMWTQAIGEVGAGLSTVLVNAQVAVVPLLSRLIDREPISRRFALTLPVLLVGVLLAGGMVEHGISGSDPGRGTVHAVGAALCYSGFLFLLRRGGQAGKPMQTYTVVLATSAVVAVAVGPWWHGLQVWPGWRAIGWLVLVAITGQLFGWLLVAFCSGRLPSAVSSAILLLTPVGAVALGAVALAERPSPLQLAGCLLVLVAGHLGTARKADGASLIRQPQPSAAARA
ncbi:multidrug DMT transporter permease [Mycobacterium scrofulaceum]|uniref:Multidrug DMT transporter permease n=1 Tax=Mycobacterium scrofulaceum TaxID=1783 RepID=A0A1A2UWX3_MYCSC|nr:multidrug DMT transporter permease [Mycobacterium scrofulaceum]